MNDNIDAIDKLVQGKDLILNQLRQVVIGQEEAVHQILMAFFAGLIKLVEYYEKGNWLLVVLDLIVLVVSVLVMLEAWSVIGKHKQNKTSVEGEIEN